MLHAVADRVVDDYLTAVDKLQDDIDEIEISVFSARGARNVGRIYHLKREVLELKRAIAPLAIPASPAGRTTDPAGRTRRSGSTSATSRTT